MGDHRDEVGCACPRIEGRGCYDARHKRTFPFDDFDPPPADRYEDDFECPCRCHSLHEDDLEREDWADEEAAEDDALSQREARR
jgi:hypothetical protein